MSPSFNHALNYYLTGVLMFTNFEFSIKSLTSEAFLFVGILCLNTIFKKTPRGKFLKINGFFYIATSLLLAPLLTFLKENPQVRPLLPILAQTGLHSLFFEIFTLPIVSIFLEICPQNLEGFFMSLIFFLNHFSKNIGGFLGTVCIYYLDIKSNSTEHINWLIIIHFMVSLVGFLMLLTSYIPNKKVHEENHEEEFEAIENKHLAYINTMDSIMLDEETYEMRSYNWRQSVPHEHKKSVGDGRHYFSMQQARPSKIAINDRDTIN